MDFTLDFGNGSMLASGIDPTYTFGGEFEDLPVSIHPYRRLSSLTIPSKLYEIPPDFTEDGIQRSYNVKLELTDEGLSLQGCVYNVTINKQVSEYSGKLILTCWKSTTPIAPTRVLEQLGPRRTSGSLIMGDLDLARYPPLQELRRDAAVERQLREGVYLDIELTLMMTKDRWQGVIQFGSTPPLPSAEPGMKLSCVGFNPVVINDDLTQIDPVRFDIEGLTIQGTHVATPTTVAKKKTIV
jgi:hypothetical protein